MNTNIHVSIESVGKKAGENIVDNALMAEINEKAVIQKLVNSGNYGELSAELKAKYCTTPEWILDRTGIKTRCFTKGTTSTLAVAAAREAMEYLPYRPEDYDFLIIATVSPDYKYSPPTASLAHQQLHLLVRDELGLKNCYTFDVGNACTSFASALLVGYSLIKSGVAKLGLVIGADKMSSTIDLADRNFSILLGDAGGAIVLKSSTESFDSFPLGAEGFIYGTDPTGAMNILARAGGSAEPLTLKAMEQAAINISVQNPDTLWQDGRKVYKEIINLILNDGKPLANTIIGKLLAKTRLQLNQINISFFHQANLRINQLIEGRMRANGYDGLVHNTIQTVGNTTSAAIPYGVADAWEQGLLRLGDLALLLAFGGGYTWGGALIRWTANIPCPI